MNNNRGFLDLGKIKEIHEDILDFYPFGVITKIFLFLIHFNLGKVLFSELF